ncbi:MAG: YdcF family protein [Eubacteriales bacterium]
MERLKRILYIMLMVLGIIGLMDTLVLVFFSNINVGTLFPGFAGALLILYVYLKLGTYKSKPIMKSKKLRKLTLVCLILFAVSFVMIESLILYYIHDPQHDSTDYVMILGGGIKGKRVSLTLKERLDKGVDYLNRYPSTKVIVSGGKGFGAEISEAEAMKRYLINKGIIQERIIVEDQSTSTMENFKYSREILIKTEGECVRDITVITSDFHIMRSKMLAERNGFKPYAIPCETPISVRINGYIREYFAVVKSYIFDK